MLLVKRQLFSQVLVQKMKAGYRIINFDESSMTHSNFQNYAWMKKGTNIQQKDKTIEPRTSLIAAVDNLGNIYASLFQGNSNTQTTILMMHWLCKILDEEDKNWRTISILLLDGASYHTNTETKKALQKLQIPVLYTAPYSP